MKGMNNGINQLGYQRSISFMDGIDFSKSLVFCRYPTPDDVGAWQVSGCVIVHNGPSLHHFVFRESGQLAILAGLQLYARG